MSSTTYDWSPVFGAIQGLGQRYQYNKMLESVLGTGVPQQQQPPPQQNPTALPTPPMTVNPGMIGGTQLPTQNIPSQPAPIPNAPVGSAPSPQPIPNAMAGQYSQLLPLLKMLPPEQGMPLLLQMVMRRPDYDATTHDGINPATGKRGTYIIDKLSGTPHWLDATPETKVQVSNGQAYDPEATAPGTVFPLQDRLRVSGGMQSADGGQTWTPIPGYTDQQVKIAKARASAREPKPPNPNAPITLTHPSAGY